jgi:hypothetical protein
MEIDMKITVVVPTIRQDKINDWFGHWHNELQGVDIIVVEDNPQRSFSIVNHTLAYTHYCWEDIDRDLGDLAWIIPRCTDCVRSYGYYKAWQAGADLIITLDDDCYPDDRDFVATHLARLEANYPTGWFQHAQVPRVRGLPYQLDTTPAVMNMGLWSHVPDLDAQTQLAHPDLRLVKSNFSFPIPPGVFAPISGMNLAFRRECLPAVYFLLMGADHGIDRFGDIWMGIFMKKICDHLGAVIVGGDPYIRHDRASDPHVNARKEAPGLVFNEHLWRDVAAMRLAGDTFSQCYLSLAAQLSEYTPYWRRLKEAMRLWVTLFE